tara:strand:+ start:51639 stop:52049 length:411 start_codon:yes stop_codon:yes gene_type:complete
MAVGDVPNVYSVGVHNVGSYQVSGIPYITGSTSLAAGAEEKITFPYVTRTITVVNHSSHKLRISFNATGSGNVVGGCHFVELDSDEDSFSFNVKCKEIYVSSDPASGGAIEYRLVAEMTNIPAARMYDLTGSGLTD